MEKRHKPKREPGDTYRFESPLPMDMVIERLNSELKSKYALPFGYIFYFVSQEKLGDSHHFEVEQLGNNWLPNRVVIGAVRQLDEQRSLVVCEIKSAERYLPAFEIVAAAVLLAAVITTLEGTAIREMVILLWALLLVATVGVTWLRRRLNQRRDPLIERIQSILQG